MKTAYFSEWAGKVSMSRAARRMGIPVDDGPPPGHFTLEDVEWCLKLVAHWEGGPPPDDEAARPVVLDEKFDQVNDIE
jgi:hypothetical protein